ncbi:MAG: LysR family transcriptional regulator [Chloroflexota bacterium]
MNTIRRVPDTDLDVRTLRHFVAVAEELSFTRAAARLFVAQQAVSRDIRQLERRLGTPLFVRTTRRVTLTPDGHRLLVRARELLAVHDAILDDVAGPGRPVIVDLLSEGRLTGPRVLEALRAAAPDLDVLGQYGHAGAPAIEQLRSAQLDIAVGRVDWIGQRSNAGLERRLVRWEPLALLLPGGHQLARLEAVPIARLEGLEIDVNPGRPDATEWTDLAGQLLALAGAVPTPPHVSAVGLENQAHHLVRQGVPILTGVDHVEIRGGIVRPLVDPVPIYPWSIAWRAGLRADVVAAIHAAADLLAANTDWLELPEQAWLPEPEASHHSRAPSRSNPDAPR